MRLQNTHFICEICGDYDVVLSSLNLWCNYGSENDGEELKLHICGNCADRIYECIQRERNKKEQR